METIQVTARNAVNAERLFAFISRAALLLGNTHLEIGSNAILMLNNVLYNNETPKQKIRFFRAVAQNDENTELVELIDEFLKIEKQLISNKHPPQHIFKAYKQIEHSLLNDYKNWQINYNAMLKELGLQNFDTLMQPNIFETYGLYVQNDIVTTKDNYFLNRVAVFKFQSPCLQNKKPIWWFPHQFYNHTFLQNFSAGANEFLPHIEKNFVELCEVNSLNLLQPIDIKNIKQQIDPHIANSNMILQQWANDCYNNNGNGNLLSSLNTIQDNYNSVFKSNDLLQRVITLSGGTTPAKLFAGEISYQNLVDFYCNEEEITEAMKQDLLDWYSEQQPFKIPAIIACLLLPDDLIEAVANTTTIENETTEEPVVNTKKYLDID